MLHMFTAAAAAVVPLARVNKGTHFLEKNQAMGMARVVNCQNGPAPGEEHTGASLQPADHQ
jgi:hypothetical protein